MRKYGLLLTVLCMTAVSACRDRKDFVPITDVVPDAILEIRYYGTYNFVGERIDGYRETFFFLVQSNIKHHLKHTLTDHLTRDGLANYFFEMLF